MKEELGHKWYQVLQNREICNLCGASRYLNRPGGSKLYFANGKILGYYFEQKNSRTKRFMGPVLKKEPSCSEIQMRRALK